MIYKSAARMPTPMPTLLLFQVQPWLCKQMIRDILDLPYDGWISTSFVNNQQITLHLFHSIKHRDKVVYRAFCCGIYREGIWELEADKPSHPQIRDNIVDLLESLKALAVQEREIILESLKEDELTHLCLWQ